MGEEETVTIELTEDQVLATPVPELPNLPPGEYAAGRRLTMTELEKRFFDLLGWPYTEV